MVSYHILFPSYCALMLAAASSSSRVADAAAAFAPVSTTMISSKTISPHQQHHHRRPHPSLLAVREAGRGGRSTAIFSSSSSSSSSDDTTDDKVAQLRAAAAKAREQADKLRQELGETSGRTATAAVATKKPQVSMEELASTVLPSLVEEADPEKQLSKWRELQSTAGLTQFGSANLRSFPVSLKMFEDRTGLTPASLGFGTGEDDANLDDFKYATLGVLGFSMVTGVGALALLPPNVGATVCYFVALLPILFLAVGSTAPQLIANVIKSIKDGNTGDGSAADDDVSIKQRICRHEAAHFCCGYWCGLPVTSVQTEPAEGVAQVEFGAVERPYNPTSVAALTVTALAGCVGEALQEWDVSRVDGPNGSAAQDLMQLETVVFRQAIQFMGAAAIQDMTRWGALTATLLLRQNADKYEQVVKAFERKASIPECITILES